jgi:hypothetical protein
LRAPERERRTQLDRRLNEPGEHVVVDRIHARPIRVDVAGLK